LVAPLRLAKHPDDLSHPFDIVQVDQQLPSVGALANFVQFAWAIQARHRRLRGAVLPRTLVIGGWRKKPRGGLKKNAGSAKILARPGLLTDRIFASFAF
jgi:hypothetical protein